MNIVWIRLLKNAEIIKYNIDFSIKTFKKILQDYVQILNVKNKNNLRLHVYAVFKERIFL